ncbi:MAG: DUF4173 domain-containing protein [Planctomycetaceae bacterium]
MQDSPDDADDRPAEAATQDAGSPFRSPTPYDELRYKRISSSTHPSATASALQPQPPVTFRELLGVLSLVVLGDQTIYRGHGYAGYALLFLLAPFLLWWSSNERLHGRGKWIVSLMLAALVGKLLWCGSHSLVFIGFTLTVAFSMTLVGLTPYAIEVISFALQTFHAGFLGIIKHSRRINRSLSYAPQVGLLSVVLPILVFWIFGVIFVMANPDLSQWFGEGLNEVFKRLHRWLNRFSPDFLEVGFWLSVWWIVAGLLRPRIDRTQYASSTDIDVLEEVADSVPGHIYPAYRNMLVTVVVLFAAYLVFEFQTLWFREFPKGFHYSGYAHEGAAWLTVALGLATVILSLVLRGGLMQDQRIGVLKRLAWLWSLENLLLAIAIYNRLFIYVGFNGMTRMRIVGIYGMSAVVVGFIMVIWKIARQKDFLWLVRRHLWTLAIAFYLLAMTPMDAIVVRYNVQRILAGDHAPAVQISVHPINSEGILLLQPLLKCDSEIIREGVRAILADYHQQLEFTAAEREKQGWTTYQLADRLALEEFRRQESHWQRYVDDPLRKEQVLKRFHEYAYQWY